MASCGARAPSYYACYTPIAFLGPVPPSALESAIMTSGRPPTTSAYFVQHRFMYDSENQCVKNGCRI
jgi:hypothetical protein